MDIKEVKEISKLIPIFVMMAENDLEEDWHKIPIGKELNHKQYEQIEKLTSKLKYLLEFVDSNIFNSEE